MGFAVLDAFSRFLLFVCGVFSSGPNQQSLRQVASSGVVCDCSLWINKVENQLVFASSRSWEGLPRY